MDRLDIGSRTEESIRVTNGFRCVLVIALAFGILFYAAGRSGGRYQSGQFDSLLFSVASAEPPSFSGKAHATPGKSSGKRPIAPPGRVLFKLDENANRNQMRALNMVMRRHKLREERRIVGRRVRLAKSQAKDKPPARGLVRALEATGAVVWAEPDYLVPQSVLPDDPSYDSQWFHTTIESPAAWDCTVGSFNVTVAVCDGGVEFGHPDLVDNMSSEGYNAVDGSAETSPVNSHGTRVAGCIGAIGNNSTGVSGVNWNVTIMPIRVSNRSDGWAYYSDMARGIMWAADNGAKVANLSYLAANSYTVDSAAQYLRDKGGLLFVSAGNQGADHTSDWPDYPSFVAVGATTSSDSRASYSNYGEFVDIVAPGSGIYTTTTGGSYTSTSGTSFSAPIAAGVAALIYAADSGASPADVEQVIFSTCVDLGSSGEDQVYGHGRVDAGAALSKVADTDINSPPTALASASPAQGEAPLTVELDGSDSSDSDGTIKSYDWNTGSGTSLSGSNVSHTYDTAGAYTVTLTVTDDLGATDSASVNITVKEPNSAPTAVASAEPTKGTLPLEVSFGSSQSSDSDGTIDSYAWDFGDGATATGGAPTHTYEADGSYTATLTVTDNDGATATDTVAITVEAANENPVASAGASPTSGPAPLDVAFDASGSSDTDGTIASYSWDFGDGNTGSGETVSHTYQSAGTYTATLTVTDDDGAQASDTLSISVESENQEPVASFTANPSSGTAPLTVSFDGSDSSDSDGSIVSYAWDLADGSSATGTTVSHEYASAGTYTVTLTVTDDDGSTGTDQVTVTVESANEPPTASFSTSATSGTAPLSVGFDASGSADPDGEITSYAWDFGDGATGSGLTPGHTYDSAGSYSAKLTVTDDQGATDTSTVTITVDAPNQAPTASASASPTSGEAPLTVELDGSGSSDSDGTINSYDWDTGSGTSLSGSNVSHTYDTAGTYTATLTVTDDLGATDSASVTISVDAPNAAPTASASAEPTSGTAPLDVDFKGSNSSDTDGTIASYSWDFGDGNTGSGETVSHTYQSAGSYTAKLTVTDDDGATDTGTVTVTVEAPNQAPTASVSASPTSGNAPLEVSFDGSGSSDSDGSVASYNWDFGDGSTGSGATVKHSYQSSGEYVAKLTVTDDDGATATDSVSISVADQPAQYTISVANISLRIVQDNGGDRVAGTVLVEDADGKPVEGATVSVKFGGILSETATGVTNSSGAVELLSKKTRDGGTATLTVTDVTAAGCSYDDTAGETSGSITLTSEKEEDNPGKGNKK